MAAANSTAGPVPRERVSGNDRVNQGPRMKVVWATARMRTEIKDPWSVRRGG